MIPSHHYIALATFFAAIGCGSESPVMVVAQMNGATGVNLDQPWLVQFDRWITTIDQVELATARGKVIAGNGNTNIALDFVRADDPVDIVTFPSRSGTFSFNFGVEVPTRNSARVTDGVGDADLILMERNGWSHLVSGQAVGPAPPGEPLPTFFFNWGFDALSRNLDCGNGVEVDGDGVVITLELDGTSMFWTSLTDEAPQTDFAHLAAADRDADTEITTDELRDVALGQSGLDGAGQASNLYQFVRAALGSGLRPPGGRCDVRS